MSSPFGNFGNSSAVPMMILQQPRDEPKEQPQEMPMRIKVAFGLLTHLWNKQAAQFCAGNVSGVEVEKYEITQQERDAQDSALMVLTKFMEGRLPRCEGWDKPIELPGTNVTPLEIGCPVCTITKKSLSYDRSTCEVCGGSGRVSIMRTA